MVQNQSQKVTVKIAEKNERLKTRVMELLHEWPDQFVHGLFEETAEKDFNESDIAIAIIGDEIVGCLMFNRKTTNEFNWLAVSKKIERGSKAPIAKQLFEKFFSTIESGTTVCFFPNTEDAFISEIESFSGKSFEPARRLYRSMGFELKEENIMLDHYGPGAYVYKVEWVL